MITAVHYVERLTVKLTVRYLADSGFKRAIRVSIGRNFFSTISPITMRKVSGKFKKMQFLGHFTIWKFLQPSLFVPIFLILFTNFGSQIGLFEGLRFFFLFVG